MINNIKFVLLITKQAKIRGKIVHKFSHFLTRAPNNFETKNIIQIEEQ